MRVHQDFFPSQEVEGVQHFSTGHVGLDRFSHQFGQLVRTLQGCGDFDCSGPVVVVEALLVGELGQFFLGHLRGVVGYDVVGGGAGTFSDFLGREVEVVELIDRKFVHDAGARHGVGDSGLELVGVGLASSVGKVENPCIDLCIDNIVDDLRVVVLFVGLLTNLLDDVLQGFDLSLDLSLNLLVAEALAVDHDEFWTLFVQADVVLGPVNQHKLKVSLRDGLLVLVAGFAVIEYLGEGVVDGAGEGEGEAFFAFGDRKGTVHCPRLDCVGILLLDDLPGCPSRLLVHLHHDLRSC